MKKTYELEICEIVYMSGWARRLKIAIEGDDSGIAEDLIEHIQKFPLRKGLKIF